MRLNFYNYVRVPLGNLVVAYMWYKEHRTFLGRPKAGKITPDVIKWASNFYTN